MEFYPTIINPPNLVLSVAAGVLSKASPGKGLPHLGRAMTMVQELKQATGTGVGLGFCPNMPPKKVQCKKKGRVYIF